MTGLRGCYCSIFSCLPELLGENCALVALQSRCLCSVWDHIRGNKLPFIPLTSICILKMVCHLSAPQIVVLIAHFSYCVLKLHPPYHFTSMFKDICVHWGLCRSRVILVRDLLKSLGSLLAQSTVFWSKTQDLTLLISVKSFITGKSSKEDFVSYKVLGWAM